MKLFSYFSVFSIDMFFSCVIIININSFQTTTIQIK